MSNRCLCVNKVNCSYQVEHVLFYCTCNAEAREELGLYFKVLEAMEADYKVIFQDMSNEQKIIAMLNGYEENEEMLLTNIVRFIQTMVCTAVPEWINLKICKPFTLQDWRQ